MLVFRNHLPGAEVAERLKLQTDTCGLLISAVDPHATLRRSSLAEDADGDDDPALQGQAMVSRWLSMHPGIAVINEGIDKWCGELSFMDEDLEGDTSAIT